MISIPIIQTICFTLYVWFVVSRYGVLSSISESWYREERMKYMFILFIGSTSIPTLFLSGISLWFLASGGFLLAVAFAPAFRSDHPIVGIIHSTGATGSIVIALYAMLIHGIYFPAIACIAASILIERLKVNNATWWVEIADFAFIEMGIFQLITLHL